MEETKGTPLQDNKQDSNINDIVLKYRQLQNEYNIILERYMEIVEERREYELVTEAIKNIDGERKCWRMIGGLMVEKNIKTSKPEIANQIEDMKKVILALEESITRKSQELRTYEAKYTSNQV